MAGHMSERTRWQATCQSAHDGRPHVRAHTIAGWPASDASMVAAAEVAAAEAEVAAAEAGVAAAEAEVAAAEAEVAAAEAAMAEAMAPSMPAATSNEAATRCPW
jgi:hypothetical protein